jgi:cell division topological specificity factor
MLKKWFRWLMIDNPAQASDEAEALPSGRTAACSRLKLVLMHDRTQLEPEKLALLRDEMVTLISKYIPIDKASIELNLEKDPDTDTVALVANIPVLSTRRQPDDDEVATSAATALPAAMAMPSMLPQPVVVANAEPSQLSPFPAVVRDSTLAQPGA